MNKLSSHSTLFPYTTLFRSRHFYKFCPGSPYNKNQQRQKGEINNLTGARQCDLVFFHGVIFHGLTLLLTQADSLFSACSFGASSAILPLSTTTIRVASSSTANR